MDFLVSEEAITVYIIAFVISVCYIIFYYYRKTRHSRIKRQNTMQLRKIAKNVEGDSSETIKKSKKLENKPSMNASVMSVASISNSDSSVKPLDSVLNMSSEVPKVENVKEKEEIENIKIPVLEEKKDESVLEILASPTTTEVSHQENIKKEEKIAEGIPSVSVEKSVKLESKKVVDKKDSINKALKMDALLNKLYQTSMENVKKSSPKAENIVSIAKEIEIEELEPIEEIGQLTNGKTEIEYTTTVPAPEEARKQLEEITKRLEEGEANSQNIQLTEFEQMQEDTAIISLDELMKRANEMYSYNEEVQYKDEGNEPISLADLEKRKQSVLEVNENQDTSVEELNIKITPVEEEAGLVELEKEKIGFKSSSVISPVYGSEVNRIHRNTDLELENTANFEKLDVEIRKTNQFIATLKELQKNLD